MVGATVVVVVAVVAVAAAAAAQLATVLVNCTVQCASHLGFMSVAMFPGLISPTYTPSPRSRRLSPSLMPSTACLEAL